MLIKKNPLFFALSIAGSTYPNGLAAGSINTSGGTKNPIASASNKSSTVSVKSPSPVPSAPSAKDDDYDFDSMQVKCHFFIRFYLLVALEFGWEGLCRTFMVSFFLFAYTLFGNVYIHVSLLTIISSIIFRSTSTLTTKTKGCVLWWRCCPCLPCGHTAPACHFVHYISLQYLKLHINCAVVERADRK